MSKRQTDTEDVSVSDNLCCDNASPGDYGDGYIGWWETSRQTDKNRHPKAHLDHPTIRPYIPWKSPPNLYELEYMDDLVPKRFAIDTSRGDFYGYLPLKSLETAAKLGANDLAIYFLASFLAYVNKDPKVQFGTHAMELIGVRRQMYYVCRRRLVDAGLVDRFLGGIELLGPSPPWALKFTERGAKIPREQPYWFGYIPVKEFAEASKRSKSAAVVFLWAHFLIRERHDHWSRTFRIHRICNRLLQFRHKHVKQMGLKRETIKRALRDLEQIDLLSEVTFHPHARPTFTLNNNFHELAFRPFRRSKPRRK